MTAVTAEAITAAFDAVGNREPIPSPGTMKRILEAAEPHIRAEVYAEIRRLAFDVVALVTDDNGNRVPFADLLGGDR